MSGAKALIFVLHLATTTETYGAVLIHPSQIQSLTRQFVSYTILRHSRAGCDRAQKPENQEEILKNLRLIFLALRGTATRTLYDAVADVVRVC